jgi:hypothetical protein
VLIVTMLSQRSRTGQRRGERVVLYGPDPRGMSLSMRPSFFVIAALALVARPAAAHMVVTPEQSEAGGWERYTLLVPTEKGSPTVRIEVKLPAGIEVVALETKPGWDAAHDPFPLGAAKIRWTGGRIPPDGMQTFDFLVMNPAAARTISWDATQWYEDGTSDHWGEPGNPERPASQTVLRVGSGARAGLHHGDTGAAATAGVAATAGQGGAASALPTGSSAVAPAARDGSAGSMPTVVSLVSLAVSALALVVAMRARGAADRVR